ncbi:MAG: hydrogenase expression/formation protein HypE [Bacteroidales bacterium]|nr:hydrogenase expression/formation protein HypE [Bacteroidales bacterium]
MNNNHILIGHGSGGKLTHQLIEDVFVRYFKNSYLNTLNDSSIVKTSAHTAFTTDSYVIDPLFFPGGDIGKLAVSGTVNDLLVSGSLPKYLSTGFIIEEGFPLADLKRIVLSMAEEAANAHVEIVTGDTKVVKKGQCDKIFINTAGIGQGIETVSHLWGKPALSPGDKIIISGFLGDHSAAIMAARNNISFEKPLVSDVAPLNKLILPLFEKFGNSIKFLRDITRGGLATILNELCSNSGFGINISEEKIPIRQEVSGFCEIFGFDPLYLANEGKIVLAVENGHAGAILKTMQSLPFGEHSEIIGEIIHSNCGKVLLQTNIGSHRILDMLSGEILPRIC